MVRVTAAAACLQLPGCLPALARSGAPCVDVRSRSAPLPPVAGCNWSVAAGARANESLLRCQAACRAAEGGLCVGLRWDGWTHGCALWLSGTLRGDPAGDDASRCALNLTAAPGRLLAGPSLRVQSAACFEAAPH